MRKLLLFIIFFLVVHFQDIYSQGYLHRDNKKIVDGNGQEILLRGMGLGGWMLQEGYMMRTSAFAGTQFALKKKIAELIGEDGMNEFYDRWLKNHCTKADLDSMAKWGFNSIRLPMHYNLFTLPIEKESVAGQNTWLDKGFTLVDSLLKWCTANQMYLILDLHAAPGGQGHDAAIADYDNTKPSLWESAANRAKTVELWKKIAEKYASYSWIGGYDILNEPNWDLPGGTMLKQLYKDIIAAIRTVDKNHIIFIEGNWFANDFTGLLPTSGSDPLMDQNMAYSFHKYWNSTNSGSIQWMLDIRNNYNVPIWLGESGENSNEWFCRTIKTMEDNNIGWAWWPLKKIGSVAGPATIVETEDYRTLLNYWEKGGTKPSVDFAKNALFNIAENARIEKCLIHQDVIDAMFRQVKQNSILPFKQHLVPGTISFADFDLGKVNRAYYDVDYMNDKETSTEWNKGSVYRNDGVDIEKCNDNQNSNGYNVGWIVKGEWLKYTVNVAQTGFYNVNFRVATSNNSGMFHVEMNGQDVTGTVVVPNTGGYQQWQSVTVNDIPLTKGTDTLTLRIDQGGFNISSMTWTGPTAVTSAPLRLLSAYTSEDGKKVYLTFNESLKSGLVLSASSFTLSKGSIISIGSVEQITANEKLLILNVNGNIMNGDLLSLSYSGTSIVAPDGKVLASFATKPVVNNLPPTQAIPGRIEAENFSESYGLSVEDCTDTGGGKDVGYSDNGDYLEFLVNIRDAGTYNVDIRYSTPDNNTKAELSVVNNGAKTLVGTADFLTTGGWQNWSTKTISVNLPAGVQRLRYTITSARFNTNYLNFRGTATSSSNLISATGLKVYPNPSCGKFNLIADDITDQNLHLQVTDSFGRKVIDEIVRTPSGLHIIDLSQNARGFYFLNIKSRLFNHSKVLIIK